MPQFPLVRRAAIAFHTHALEMEGYEADDLIATYAKQAEAKGARVTIVSSDKDLMQLVSDKVEMLDTMKNKVMGIEAVHEKFGVGPDKVIDIQALAGDSVDNIPGAPGIGVKTAALLINEYGDVETLLERAEEIKQPKRRQTLLDNKDQVLLSRDLVTLKTDVPIEVKLEDLAVAGSRSENAARLSGKRWSFARLPGVCGETFEMEGALEAPSPDDMDVDREAYETVRDMKSLEAWIARARDAGVVAVDTETDNLDAVQANLIGVSMATAPGEACYIPLGHVDPAGSGDGDMFGADPPRQIKMSAATKALKDLLEDPSVLKVGQNIKYDQIVLSSVGITHRPCR